MAEMSRREAIGGMGALGLGALGLAGSAAGAGQPAGRAAASTPGWDARAGRFVLPDLPYGPDELEPHLDGQTMRLHHERHHKGYVDGANTALERLAEIRAGGGDPATLELWLRRLSFHTGGHVNHTLFWGNMAPEGQGGEPAGALLRAIERDFGSFAAFEKHFRDSAGAVEGSGWGWLVHDSVSGRLMVLQMHNQQHSVFAGATPLLGVDVWEHAYYLRYQNRRADYLTAFMKVVNWNEVARRFGAVAGA